MTNPMTGQPKINNWLWQSIVVTLCCCLPLGIVGIIFATQVNGKLAAGDIVGAQDAAKKAKMFTLIGLAGGVLIWVIVVGINILSFMAAVAGSQ